MVLLAATKCARALLCRKSVLQGPRRHCHRQPQQNYSILSVVSPYFGSINQIQGCGNKVDGNGNGRAVLLQFYHETTMRCHASSEKETDDGEAKDEEIPSWQNPLHAKNPEKKKIFVEDFASEEEMPIQPLMPFDDEDGNIVPPPYIEAIAHEIVLLNMLELKELTDRLSEHFGITEEMLAPSYGGGGVETQSAPAAAPEEVVEQKSLFDVKLVGFDAKAKIKVIKEVRAVAGLGLKEAKELVESVPKVVQKDLKPDKAEELKAQLEAIGAQVEIV